MELKWVFMLQKMNDFAEILKLIQDTGMKDGSITFRVIKGNLKPYPQIVVENYGKKTVDGISGPLTVDK
jgi:hypothetical protein